MLTTRLKRCGGGGINSSGVGAIRCMLHLDWPLGAAGGVLSSDCSCKPVSPKGFQATQMPAKHSCGFSMWNESTSGSNFEEKPSNGAKQSI